MENFGRILENTFNEIYMFDAETFKFCLVNLGARKNLQYSSEELAKLTPVDLKPEYTKETFEQLIKPLRESQKPMVVFETTHERKDGTLYPVSVRLQLMHEELPPVFVAIIEDITERKIYEKKLWALSTHDGLTEIANRRYFDEILEKEWKRAARGKFCVSLIMLDIDYFKNFNDTYGHQAGDECLKQAADIIKKTLHRPGDMVARYGGEEFVVVLPDTESDGALRIAEAVRINLESSKIEHSQSNVGPYLTASLGVSTIIPELTNSPSSLIASADKALYNSKKGGRNQVTAADLPS